MRAITSTWWWTTAGTGVLCGLATFWSPSADGAGLELRSQLPEVMRGAHLARAADMFAASPLDGICAAVLQPTPEIAYVRVLHGRTACLPENGRGGNPMVHVGGGKPAAGQPFVVEWSTVACATPAPMPFRPAALLVGLTPAAAPLDLTPSGSPGCTLLVEPEFLLVPGTSAADVLWQQGGTVRLDWTPPAGLVGSTFFVQLIVLEADANAAGLLVSPGLEVHVGS